MLNLLAALAIAAALVWLVKRLLRSGGSTPSSASAETIMPRINGPKEFRSEVVGESFYVETFVKLLGDNAGTEHEVFCDAVLRLEDDNPHDAQAVGVYIDGLKVGHLSRELARSMRKALVRDGFGSLREVAVGARVYCGGPDEMYSVGLDLPETDSA